MEPNMKVDRSEIAPERNGDPVAPQPQLPSGLYRHKDSGQEAIIQTDPLYGDAQAAAFTRVGFEFVRKVEPDEIKTIASASDSHAASPDRETDAQVSYNKGLEARLNALEAENARLVEAAAPTPGASAEAQASVESAKASGTDKVEATTGVPVDPATGSEKVVGSGAPVEPAEPVKVSKNDSRVVLEEVALKEGVAEKAEDLAQYVIKAELVSAIEVNRESKTNGGNE